MSVLSWQSRLLTLRPRVEVANGALRVTRTPLPFWLCFGEPAVITEVSLTAPVITILTRAFPWQSWRRRERPVSDFSHIDYGYSAITTDFGAVPGYAHATDEFEMFDVKLVAHDGTVHRVGTFSGSGAVHTGWAGVLLLNDDLLDLVGTQESESQKLVNVLAKITGLPLMKPLDLEGFTRDCPGCGREVLLTANLCNHCASVLPPPDTPPPAAVTRPSRRPEAVMPEMRVDCPHCGRSIGRHARRCMHCARVISPPAPETGR